MDFKELQDLTLDHCQELAGKLDFSKTKIKFYINRAEKDFLRQTKQHERIIDITTTADQEYYDADDAANLAYVYHVFRVRYISAGETERGHKLTYMEYELLPEQYTYGTPTHYWITGNNSRNNTDTDFRIGTHPIVSESSGTIRVWASCFPNADMSVDSNVPFVKEAWQDALALYAAGKLFSIYGHEKREWEFKSRRLLAEYQTMVDDANFRAIKQTDELTQVKDVYNEEDYY